MTNNLTRTEVAAGQDQKEVTINQSDGILDQKVTEPLTLDFTSADVTLTTAQWRNAAVVCTNVAAARALNTPQSKGFLLVVNSAGAEAVTVTRGSGTVEVPAGEVRLVYQDGTTDGVVNAGGGGGSGSSSYDFGFAFGATPDPDAVIQRVHIGRAITIPADFDGSSAAQDTNPTADPYVIDVRDDGVSIGTISVAAAGTVTFATDGGTAKSVAAGSVIAFVAPSDLADTIAGFSCVILATED